MYRYRYRSIQVQEPIQVNTGTDRKRCWFSAGTGCGAVFIKNFMEIIGLFRKVSRIHV
jgi:hypothetical protein